jgi:hypothetical protein
MTVELASEERFRKIEGNGEEPEKFTCQMLIGSVNCDQCTWEFSGFIWVDVGRVGGL